MNARLINYSHKYCRASFKISLSAILFATMLAPITSTRAADSWLSRAIEIEPSGQAKVSLPTYRAEKSAPVIAKRGGTSTRTLFDVTVSLYNKPAGDGDPATVSGEAQEPYEEIVRHFADAVCEQTNGNHRLGKVRLFTSRNQQAAADIVWTDISAPRAHLSGFGASGLHIFFGDVFPNGSGGTTDFDMLANPEAAGYTLGHEWGHYTYGLFDEYVGNDPLETDSGTPQPTDLATIPSIMSSQWDAVGGNPQWLNHSTANNIGTPARTAQGRSYGKSGWEVLVQATSEDPKSGDKLAQPNRTQYTTLANVAPTAADNWVKTELPLQQSTCRNDLDIIWVDGDLDLQIVLDRSGSMGGSPIANAKQAASLLVDTIADGQTGLGVASFSRALSQDAPIQAIPDPGDLVKAQIKSIINGIRAGGSTGLYDGALSSLAGLNAYQASTGTTAPKVVFLLSDGGDTSSSASESDVITEYQAANVPMFTFGFGSASPTGTLLRMANMTGGQYTFSPTDLSQITRAFLQANAVASDLKNIVDQSASLAPGAQSNVVLVVDAGIVSLNLVLDFDGSVNDLLLTVTDPNGSDVSEVTFECNQISSIVASCAAQVDASVVSARGNGNWQINVSNQAAVDRNVNLYAAGLPGTDGAFNVRVAGLRGNEITYPEPIVLTTSVIKDLPVTGVNLAAEITDPNGQALTFNMLDDGTGGDAKADDGIYSAILGYEENGTYEVEVRVDNSGGTARFTTNGLQSERYSSTTTGTVPVGLPLPAITENFARISRTNIVVTGRPSSDGDNSFFTATELLADNQAVSGVIDETGDEDFFVIRNIDSTQPLFVRATDLSLGMNPELVVFAEDRTTEVANVNLPANVSATGYLYVEIPVGELTEPMYAVVKHADANATQGGFSVSAGEAITTDRPPNALPVAVDDQVAVVEGDDVVINVLSNDTDADGDSLNVSTVSDSTNGLAVTQTAAGLAFNTQNRPFDLAPGDVLTDRFTYDVTDGQGFRRGNVVVTVTGNTPPSVTADSVTVEFDKTISFSVLGNDSDVDGQVLSVSAIDEMQTEGDVTLNADNTVTYDPAGAFNSLTEGQEATTSFSYTAKDSGGLESSGVVTVKVQRVNVAPPPPSNSGGGGTLNVVLLAGMLLLLVRRRTFRNPINQTGTL